MRLWPYTRVRDLKALMLIYGQNLVYKGDARNPRKLQERRRGLGVFDSLERPYPTPTLTAPTPTLNLSLTAFMSTPNPILNLSLHLPLPLPQMRYPSLDRDFASSSMSRCLPPSPALTPKIMPLQLSNIMKRKINLVT